MLSRHSLSSAPFPLNREKGIFVSPTHENRRWKQGERGTNVVRICPVSQTHKTGMVPANNVTT